MPYEINWNQIDDVLLDMDGTLLDLHYDATFWLKMYIELWRSLPVNLKAKSVPHF